MSLGEVEVYYLRMNKYSDKKEDEEKKHTITQETLHVAHLFDSLGPIPPGRTSCPLPYRCHPVALAHHVVVVPVVRCPASVGVDGS